MHQPADIVASLNPMGLPKFEGDSFRPLSPGEAFAFLPEHWTSRKPHYGFGYTP